MKTTKKIRKVDWERHYFRGPRKRDAEKDNKQLSLDLFDDEASLLRGSHPLKKAATPRVADELVAEEPTRVSRIPKNPR